MVGGIPYFDHGWNHERVSLLQRKVAGEVGGFKRGGHEDDLDVGTVRPEKFPNHEKTEVCVLVTLMNLVKGQQCLQE